MKALQGEIWWVDPTPKMGSEQKGTRPALVLQNDLANKYLNTTIVAMVSSSGVAHMPEMVPMGTEYGLKQQSHVDFSQIFTIDERRLKQKIGKISVQKWGEVERAIEEIFEKTIL